MRVFETFSKREKRQFQGKKDVYQYDTLLQAFRVQVIHIWASAIGPFFQVSQWETASDSNRTWREIHDTLSREIGVIQLGKSAYDNPFEQCKEYLQSVEAKQALDLIEISFVAIDNVVRRLGHADWRRQTPDGAIEELNYRFREHNIGYQFVPGGRLIKIDTEYVHSEVVRPAISLLQDARFRGPEDEFLKAHEHYRHGRHKEAISEALKAFESTMKAICDARRWHYSPTATAKELIEIVLANGLIPSPLQSQFASLRSVLESGLPTVRNKASGHGQGAEPVEVPGYLAAYALHLAASNIVFLVEAHRTAK